MFNQAARPTLQDQQREVTRRQVLAEQQKACCLRCGNALRFEQVLCTGCQKDCKRRHHN